MLEEGRSNHIRVDYGLKDNIISLLHKFDKKRKFFLG